MKLTVKSQQIDNNPEFWLRRAGYALIFDRRRGAQSFVKRLGNNFYPRLHLYFSINGDNITFDIHLDQKQASYEGSHMHNAEYDNEFVAREINYLKSLLGIMDSNSTPLPPKADNPRTKFAPAVNIKSAPLRGNLEADLAQIKNYKPKTWWQKIFT